MIIAQPFRGFRPSLPVFSGLRRLLRAPWPRSSAGFALGLQVALALGFGGAPDRATAGGCPAVETLSSCGSMACAVRAVAPVLGGGSAVRSTELFLDRVVYARRDRYAHAFLQSQRDGVDLELRRDGSVAAREHLDLGASGAVEFLLPLTAFTPGRYALALAGVPEPFVRFEVSASAASGRSTDWPDEVPLVFSSTPDGAIDAWPIQTAVAFPRGTVVDLDRVALLEDGEPVVAQWSVRSWWSADCSSVRWASLDFVARRGGEGWRDYRIVLDRSTIRRTRAELPSLSLNRADAVVDGRAIGGPYVVDRSGSRYRPSGAAWQLEESGPIRSTARSVGVLRDPAGREHARFEARVSAFAGLSAARLRYRVILTPEALAAGLRDAGWEVPLAAPVGLVRSAMDGRALRAEVPEGSRDATRFIHQDRGDRCRWVVGERTEVGGRCDGWLGVGDTSGATAIALRHMAETFPRELELRSDRLVAHLWPAHGRRAFSPEEERSRGEIYKLRFAHQGETLELRLPAEYEAELRRLDGGGGPDGGWDAEGALDRAVEIDAAGVALSAELWIVWDASPGGGTDFGAWARAVDRSPHALPAPTAIAASRAEGEWRAESAAHFPVVEHALGELYPRYVAAIRSDPARFGTWIHGGMHNGWDPRRGVAPLHRVWQASHYRNVSGAWLLYLRSGDVRLLDWARDTSRHFRDVHVLNHPVGHDAVGAMDHCKGFLPWAARSATWGHWIDGDALRWRSLLLGDRAAADLYTSWGRALIDERLQLGVDRGTVSSLGELVAYYRSTFDPRALVSIRDWAETSLATPFEEYPQPASFPVWHREWMARYFELTRDPRVVERAAAWLAAGYEDAATLAFVAQHDTGVPAIAERLEVAAATLYAEARTVYEAPGEPFDGYGSWRSNSRARWLFAAPYLLPQLEASGTPEAAAAFDPVYPAVAVPAGDRGRRREAGLEVLIWERRDRRFTVRLRTPRGFGDLGVASYRLVSPSGRIVAAGDQRFLDEPERVLEIDRDGERGLYRLECRGHRCPLLAPLSDLPEAARLRPGRRYNALGRMSFLLEPRRSIGRQRSGSSAAASLELRFEASPGVTPAYPETALPSWVAVASTEGPTWIDTSLFHFGERREAIVPLPSDLEVTALRLDTASRYGPVLELAPTGALLGRSADDLRRIARALDWVGEPPPSAAAAAGPAALGTE